MSAEEFGCWGLGFKIQGFCLGLRAFRYLSYRVIAKAYILDPALEA